MTLTLNQRENRVLKALKEEDGKWPSDELIQEFVDAKQQLQFGVMADSLGGLFSADSLGSDTLERGARYERALAALEEEVLT